MGATMAQIEAQIVEQDPEKLLALVNKIKEGTGLVNLTLGEYITLPPVPGRWKLLSSLGASTVMVRISGLNTDAEDVQAPYESEQNFPFHQFNGLYKELGRSLFKEYGDFTQWLIAPNNDLNGESPLLFFEKAGNKTVALEEIRLLLLRLQYGVMA
jgi:hypothetical protein